MTNASAPDHERLSGFSVIATANAARGQGERAADRQRLIVVALETKKGNLNMKRRLSAAMIVLTRRSAAPGASAEESFKGIGSVADRQLLSRFQASLMRANPNSKTVTSMITKGDQYEELASNDANSRGRWIYR